MPGGRSRAPTTQHPNGRNGRPSSLTEETVKLILARIHNLGSYDDAAISGGVDPTTFLRWMRKGRADFQAGKSHTDYYKFYLRVEQANLNVKAILQGRVMAGTSRDPRLALKVLERRWSNEWGLKIKVEDATKTPPSSPRDRFMKRLADIEERQSRAATAFGALHTDPPEQGST